MVSFFYVNLLYHNMRLQALREEVAHPRTSIQLCMLGIVGGNLRGAYHYTVSAVRRMATRNRRFVASVGAYL